MASTDALDTALDRMVVPGYSVIGYRLRRRWWPEDLPAGTLTGTAVAVTGANSGVGLATAAGAAGLGAEVVMLCRDVRRGQRARAQLLQRQPSARLVVVECDVSDPDSIGRAVAEVRTTAPQLHGLVHNAGVMPARRTESVTGHELTFATHVLGPHLLTALLQPQLVADGDARVVFVSSGGMYAQPLRVDDLQYELGPYKPTTAYARTKRMQVALAEQWADELRDLGVSVHSMHPGWADTPGVLDSLPRFARLTGPILRSPEQGADTVVWLLGAIEAGTSTGLFWHDRRPRPTTYLRREDSPDELARDLWDVCVDATGLPDAVS